MCPALFIYIYIYIYNRFRVIKLLSASRRIGDRVCLCLRSIGRSSCDSIRLANVSAPEDLVDSLLRSFSLLTDSPAPTKQRRDYGSSYDGCEDPENVLYGNVSTAEHDGYEDSENVSSGLPSDSECCPESPVWHREDIPAPTEAELDEYEAALKRSEGFGDIPDIPAVVQWGGIFPVSPESFCTTNYVAREAIRHLNEKLEKRFEFLRIVRLNCRHSWSFQYNITFEAKNPENGSIETFRAIVLMACSFGPTILRVEYCDRYPDGYLDQPVPFSLMDPWQELRDSSDAQ